VGIEVRQDLVRDTDGASNWAGVLADALNDILADENLYSSLTSVGQQQAG
jgi:predicted N-formylglutamate amidohydrolase